MIFLSGEHDQSGLFVGKQNIVIAIFSLMRGGSPCGCSTEVVRVRVAQWRVATVVTVERRDGRNQRCKHNRNVSYQPKIQIHCQGSYSHDSSPRTEVTRGQVMIDVRGRARDEKPFHPQPKRSADKTQLALQSFIVWRFFSVD